MKRIVKGILRRFGLTIVKIRYLPGSLPDISDSQRGVIESVRPFTMTSMERLAALIDAVEYVVKAKVPGDIAECGVWRGGSMMAVAKTLITVGDTSRSLYLYDTFEGMSPPTDEDKTLSGRAAQAQLDEEDEWCIASLEDVRRNILSTGYPEERVHLIKGKVEDTIPEHGPGGLALLRLDTDWYVSTKHELEHLYPLLRRKGVLVLDDYGHWQGARKAVDEYFMSNGLTAYLHRIDYSGRLVLKVDD